MNQTQFSTLVCAIILAAAPAARASTYSQPVGADTFVSSGEPDVNFGQRGGMEIAAPTTAQPRTELILLQFNTSALQTSFDADYGAGNWAVTSLSLTLFSSVATAGQQPNNASFNKIAAGAFEFDLLGNDSWSENAITWNTLPAILPGNNNGNTLAPLGTFFWNATGQASATWMLNDDVNLTQKILNGGLVSLLGQPAAGSTVGYLSNARTLSPALLNVTAEAVPEPSATALVIALLGVMGGFQGFTGGKRKEPFESVINGDSDAGGTLFCKPTNHHHKPE